MKRFLFLLMCSTWMLPSMAQDGYDYPYMVFTTTDGQQTSLGVEALRMQMADGVLTASNTQGTVSFSLTTLAEMHFSETEVATGIEDVESEKLKVKSDTPSLGSGRGEAYDLTGRKVSAHALTPGIYVMRQGSVTKKIMVK